MSKKTSPSEDIQASMDELSFEEAMTQLEEIVQQLEHGQLTLEQSVALYERGMRMSMVCDAKLKQAEQKIEMVTSSDTSLVKQPFLSGGDKEEAD